VTQLSHRLLEHLGVRGALQTLLLLVVVWSAWVGTSWITNWFDPARLPVRLMLVAVMLASLFMSVAIPDAFGERGLMFALAYVAIQVGRDICAHSPGQHPSAEHQLPAGAVLVRGLGGTVDHGRPSGRRGEVRAVGAMPTNPASVLRRPKNP
jgi:Bacterial low temperature requirement A protein (LtrA)